jgi:hypothetical protein
MKEHRCPEIAPKIPRDVQSLGDSATIKKAGALG